jgi:hypothetical protein
MLRSLTREGTATQRGLDIISQQPRDLRNRLLLQLSAISEQPLKLKILQGINRIPGINPTPALRGISRFLEHGNSDALGRLLDVRDVGDWGPTLEDALGRIADFSPEAIHGISAFMGIERVTAVTALRVFTNDHLTPESVQDAFVTIHRLVPRSRGIQCIVRLLSPDPGYRARGEILEGQITLPIDLHGESTIPGLPGRSPQVGLQGLLIVTNRLLDRNPTGRLIFEEVEATDPQTGIQARRLDIRVELEGIRPHAHPRAEVKAYYDISNFDSLDTQRQCMYDILLDAAYRRGFFQPTGMDLDNIISWIRTHPVPIGGDPPFANRRWWIGYPALAQQVARHGEDIHSPVVEARLRRSIGSRLGRIFRAQRYLTGVSVETAPSQLRPRERLTLLSNYLHEIPEIEDYRAMIDSGDFIEFY